MLFSVQVSIHLMFLLIGVASYVYPNYLSFNTSHVSINPVLDGAGAVGEWGFNTSHVSINQMSRKDKLQFVTVSIHLMFLLICSLDKVADAAVPFQYISCFY